MRIFKPSPQLSGRRGPSIALTLRCREQETSPIPLGKREERYHCGCAGSMQRGLPPVIYFAAGLPFAEFSCEATNSPDNGSSRNPSTPSAWIRRAVSRYYTALNSIFNLRAHGDTLRGVVQRGATWCD